MPTCSLPRQRPRSARPAAPPPMRSRQAHRAKAHNARDPPARRGIFASNIAPAVSGCARGHFEQHPRPRAAQRPQRLYGHGCSRRGRDALPGGRSTSYKRLTPAALEINPTSSRARRPGPTCSPPSVAIWSKRARIIDMERQGLPEPAERPRRRPVSTARWPKRRHENPAAGRGAVSMRLKLLRRRSTSSRYGAATPSLSAGSSPCRPVVVAIVV